MHRAPSRNLAVTPPRPHRVVRQESSWRRWHCAATNHSERETMDAELHPTLILSPWLTARASSHCTWPPIHLVLHAERSGISTVMSLYAHVKKCRQPHGQQQRSEAMERIGRLYGLLTHARPVRAALGRGKQGFHLEHMKARNPWWYG